MGGIAVLGFIVGVQFVKLIIRGPIKSIFKNRYTGYVEFEDLNKKTPDNTNPLWFLEIFIPNKLYAEKFAILNAVDSESLKARNST